MFDGMVLASIVGVLFAPPLFVAFERVGEAAIRVVRRRRTGEGVRTGASLNARARHIR
jgi:hypothetical protein